MGLLFPTGNFAPGQSVYAKQMTAQAACSRIRISMTSRSYKSVASGVVLAWVLILSGCQYRHFHFPMFTASTFSLTASINGTGSGSVTSAPAGINCGSTCVASFAEGTPVTLTATAFSGSTFLGWAGGCSGAGTCSVTMGSDQTVMAFFALNTFALSVGKFGGGSGIVSSTPAGISCGATCVASFSSGTAVTLSAAANLGSTFDGWSGACSGSGACVVTMTSAQSVNATFLPELTPSFHHGLLSGREIPEVLYADASSGPIAGGENNLGTYLSIYGRHFGSALSAIKVYIGGAEVANYRRLGAIENGVEQITVQVGPLANVCTPTTVSCPALPVIVCVNGRCSDVDPSATFTPNTGRIFFVSLDGDDLTAVVGDVHRPFRTLQSESPTQDCLGPVTETGVYSNLRPGDHVVVRGGDWSDVGRDRAWLSLCELAQTADFGAASNRIHVTSYPGERVRYTVRDPAGLAFRDATSGTGRYVSFSNIEMK
jgi:hypothetical protein